MNMYEVTVGIPVYNVELYIEKCMHSVLNQTFKSIEILVIDDKGIDKSMDVVRRLQANHPRGKDIRIVDNIYNKGLGETRNIAIREATGKYFYFLDSDDYISSNCIELFYTAMIKEHVNIVIGSCQLELLDGTVKRLCQLPSIVSRKPDELLMLRCGILRQVLLTSAWNVLYDLHFLRSLGIHYQACRKSEDTLFEYDLYPKVNSFVLLSSITYFYVLRPGSLSFFESRKCIPYDEVRDQIEVRNYGKRKLMELQDKPYFFVMTLFIMHYSYNGIISIFKNRNYIIPSIKDSDINELLKFPLSFRQILFAGHYKVEFFFYYIFSHVPCWVKKKALFVICKYYNIRQHM